MPRPIFSAPIFSASRFVNSSRTDSATWKRFAEVQASPMFRIFASSAPSTAASRSASSKTRNGAFPPSSIDTFSTFLADASISERPTSVEPVKDSFRSRPSSISGPVVLPDDDVVRMFTTPPGSPASSRICARASIESGVCCAGFTTLVQPAAIAGPSLRVPIAIGKFQGVIISVGPTGCFITSTRLVAFANCL